MLYYAPQNMPEPTEDSLPSVFLAGTIDMSNSADWQDRAQSRLLRERFTVCNPRRPDWDSSWVQTIETPQFREQVEWELNHIDLCDFVFFHFAEGSKSPVTMLELGICTHKPASRIIVSCPPGFWRKGNIDIVCARVDISVYTDMEQALEALITTRNAYYD